MAIANRRMIDLIRRRSRQARREQQPGAAYETFPDPAAGIEERAGSLGLETAVNALPAGQRQAIQLLKLQELSLKEAAAVSGQSIAALKVATHRALRSLRDALTRSNDRDHDT